MHREGRHDAGRRAGGEHEAAAQLLRRLQGAAQRIRKNLRSGEKIRLLLCRLQDSWFDWLESIHLLENLGSFLHDDNIADRTLSGGISTALA